MARGGEIATQLVKVWPPHHGRVDQWEYSRLSRCDAAQLQRPGNVRRTIEVVGIHEQQM